MSVFSKHESRSSQTNTSCQVPRSSCETAAVSGALLRALAVKTGGYQIPGGIWGNTDRSRNSENTHCHSLVDIVIVLRQFKIDLVIERLIMSKAKKQTFTIVTSPFSKFTPIGSRPLYIILTFEANSNMYLKSPAYGRH